MVFNYSDSSILLTGIDWVFCYWYITFIVFYCWWWLLLQYLLLLVIHCYSYSTLILMTYYLFYSDFRVIDRYLFCDTIVVIVIPRLILPVRWETDWYCVVQWKYYGILWLPIVVVEDNWLLLIWSHCYYVAWYNSFHYYVIIHSYYLHCWEMIWLIVIIVVLLILFSIYSNLLTLLFIVDYYIVDTFVPFDDPILIPLCCCVVGPMTTRHCSRTVVNSPHYWYVTFRYSIYYLDLLLFYLLLLYYWLLHYCYYNFDGLVLFFLTYEGRPYSIPIRYFSIEPAGH